MTTETIHTDSDIRPGALTPMSVDWLYEMNPPLPHPPTRSVKYTVIRNGARVRSWSTSMAMLDAPAVHAELVAGNEVEVRVDGAVVRRFLSL